MKNRLKTAVWIVVTVAATYAVTEWSEGKKSGLHEVREVQSFEVLPVPEEGQRLVLQAKLAGLEQTIAQYRAEHERMIDECLERIARIEARVAQLAAQRIPVPHMATVPVVSRSVRWASAVPVPNLATLAREAGFTKVQVRP